MNFVMRDVHWCVTVFYQQIENGKLANQIQGFTIDYGKFMLQVVYEMATFVSVFFQSFSKGTF